MRHDLRKTGVLIIGAIASGSIGWSGELLFLPGAAALPYLWSRASSRLAASVVSAAYFLSASRGLPQGIAEFFGTDIWSGLMLWIAASVSFTAVHSALWTAKSDGNMMLRYLAAMTLTALPPFGITGWAHPLTAAGVLFPGWSWWGLLAMAAGLMGLATRIGPAVAIALTGLWLWSAAWPTPPLVTDGWHGVDLRMGVSLGRDATLGYQRDMIATVRALDSRDAEVVILPESALGFWTPAVERLWQNGLQHSDITVLAGASVVHDRGYDNVLVSIGAAKSGVVYRERMPVPVSMWRPWERWIDRVSGEIDGHTGGGVEARFFENPVIGIAGKQIAPLICYEQLILWPIIHSMLHSPHIMVLVGNSWWTAGSNIMAIQRASAEAWSRLFGVPLVSSFNT